MGSGLEHDNSTKIFSVLYGLVIGLTIDFRSGICGGIAFLIGGLWLSPDLDIKSKPLQRWGILKIIWWPYRKLIRHRSVFSHGPIIGSFIRISYLISLIVFLTFMSKNQNYLYTATQVNMWREIYSSYLKEILVILGGIELSAWIHMIQDMNSVKIKSKK